MKTLTSSEISIRLVDSYIAHIESLYADAPEFEAERLIMVLKIYRFVLKGRVKPGLSKTLPLDTVKHALRQGEIILIDIQENEPAMMAGWYMGCDATNPAQRLCNVLCSVLNELTKEIMHVESQFPEFKAEFDQERARYRRMKDEADEALRLD